MFTDRHAYLTAALFLSDRSLLGRYVDFDILQRSDFKTDPDDPSKKERYQAEALAYRHVPVDAIRGIGCYTSDIKSDIENACSRARSSAKVVVRPEWYFS